MNAITLLNNQFSTINEVLHGVVDDLTDREWITRAAPGQNLIGFTIWHLARTQDCHVQTFIRGVPEVITASRWKNQGGLTSSGFGLDISLEAADAIARTTERVVVLEYADVVHKEITAWLHGLDEGDLDRVPDIQSHIAALPEYQTKAVEEAIFDKPVWYVLGPCLGHIRGHLGEVMTLKSILRGTGQV
jgi:hypothetical protein